MNYGEAKAEIREVVRSRGPYWNNIVASVLNIVAKEHGDDTANQLIIDCKLERHGWQQEGGKHDGM